jgi:hypothetical protein
MVSLAFLVETTSTVVFGVASVLAVVALGIIVGYLIFRFRGKRRVEKSDSAME